MIYDVAIIGAGVIGGLIARELSQYNIKIALLEKNNDIATGTSKANSAIVHSGFDAVTGSLKAKFNVEGSKMMKQVCKELSVPYKNIGALVLAFDEEDRETLHMLLQRGTDNGVEGLHIIEPKEIAEIEPNVNKGVVAALSAPTTSIICPYELTIGSIENAVTNGAELHRNFKVEKISFENEIFTLKSANESIQANIVINAAGVHCDEIAAMIGDDSIQIIPRLGEYLIFDKRLGDTVSNVIFQCPNKMGKGVLVTPTVDGNLLVGPTAIDIEDKSDVATSIVGIEKLKKSALRSVPSLKFNEAITSFAGLRAHSTKNDFIIAPSDKNRRFINVAGIESPGLSAAPAIAVYVKNILLDLNPNYEKNPTFNPTRKSPIRFREMTHEEQAELIRKNKNYGRIICRCETITEGEILDAIHAPAGARDVDGVKRRTRAGMGRCQGGFCSSKVVEILARELSKPIHEITKFGGESKILFGKTK